MRASGQRASSRSNPDGRDGQIYVVHNNLMLAVDVALAAGRPLLLRGLPGSGKSSFPAFVARQRGWSYYEYVVTSRTEAQDLLWTFDHVRRLADAHAQNLDNDETYITPGVLWWAFAPLSAARFSHGRRPTPRQWQDHPTTPSSVVLIDEIDKADPDVPNALLVPLGSKQFPVPPLNLTIEPDQGTDQLVVITTNGQRELPRAFLRRCVVITLSEPTEAELLDIAVTHLNAEGPVTVRDHNLAGRLAKIVVGLREKADWSAAVPSTAEFLDALYACRELKIQPDDANWAALMELVLTKPVGDL
jgi:MoxR-like ATPase